MARFVLTRLAPGAGRPALLSCGRLVRPPCAGTSYSPSCPLIPSVPVRRFSFSLSGPRSMAYFRTKMARVWHCRRSGHVFECPVCRFDFLLSVFTLRSKIGLSNGSDHSLPFCYKHRNANARSNPLDSNARSLPSRRICRNSINFSTNSGAGRE
jgi:hypothetical protein